MIQHGSKAIKASVKKLFFRVLYPTWSVNLDRLKPGYTVLLPVPPDLPVLFKLSLDVVGRQDPTHRLEVVVVPDRPDQAFRACVESARRECPQLNLRLVEPSGFDLHIRSVANTSTIHWMQVLRGIRGVKSTHMILHDADLFISDPAFFRRRFETCQEQGLSCLAVEYRHDMPVGTDSSLGREGSDRIMLPELSHLVGTWELILDVRWLCRFPPAATLPQYINIKDKHMIKHLDTFHYIMMITSPERIGCLPEPEKFIHFGNVTSQYRFFQAATSPFHDRGFKLWLLRLLIDTFDPDRPGYSIPSLVELIEGISNPSSRVYYDKSEQETKAYEIVKSQLVDLIRTCQLQSGKSKIEHFVSEFDRRYG